MKNPITYWLKRMILLVLLLVQVWNVYGAKKVLTGIEPTSVESAHGCEFVNSWSDFSKAGKNFSKTNPLVLEKYLKLSEKNKTLVLKFSDEPGKSTLARFLEDCDDDFVKLLDDNPQYLECFTSHKDDSKWDIDKFVEQGEEILGNPNLSDLQKSKLTQWVDHSSDATKFGKITEKGIALNKSIVKELTSRSGKLFDDLEAYLGLDEGILKKYEIYTEVPLKTEGGFMKADVVLVRRGELGIEDIIVIENKLSSGTNYTVRQKEGWKKLANGESLEVTYAVEGKDASGKATQLVVGDSFGSNKVKPIKISDHGETDIANTVISYVPVIKWKDYEYKPK